MGASQLSLENVGPITRADVTFGDLTVLVGPQATGKSVFLQFLKLLVDTGYVLAELKRYGLHWETGLPAFLDIYLGEGMRGLWTPGKSHLWYRRHEIDLEKLVKRQRTNRDSTAFFVPAQRVLTLGRGWPRPFTDYSSGDPFTVRDFSEKMRLQLESELEQDKPLFPQQRLKGDVRELLAARVFNKFRLHVDRHGAQKRLVLSQAARKETLPFMVWSAGQREFVPLLLGFYWLLPPTKVSRRANIEWVVIEEIEMGLHPQAISAALLLVFDLLSRGYRVCLSTHSPHILDVVWGLQTLKTHGAKPQEVLELFGVKASAPLVKMAESVLQKESRVYYFDPKSQTAKDISNLDPATDDEAEAGWGGLTEFSGRVADIVARVVGAASAGNAKE